MDRLPLQHPSETECLKHNEVDAMHRKLGCHSERNSSSKQTSTFHQFEGSFEEGGSQDMGNADSGWRPIQVSASPFDAFGSKPTSELDTPPESGSEDSLRIVRQKSAIGIASIPERTKSKLLADIAEQVSRNQYMRAGHTRRNSGDSQDSCRDPLRKARKRRWHLTKAFSAPGDQVYEKMNGKHWNSGGPEGANWATEIYHPERPSHHLSEYRPEFSALKNRTAGRKRYTGRFRTSKFIGVGSSNRKTQWQARILVQGKVTHLGYYASEEEAARVYDRVALSLNPSAQTNFPASHYPKGGTAEFSGLAREDLQRALGVNRVQVREDH